MTEPESPSTAAPAAPATPAAPAAILTAALDSKPDGAQHIVLVTTKKTGRKKDKDLVISRAFCGVRGELSPTRTEIAPDSMRHPLNDDFDSSVSPICLACCEAFRTGVAPSEEVEVEAVAVDRTPEEKRLALLQAVRFMYDIQKERIQSGNRAGPQAAHAQAKLDPKQAHFMKHAAERLELLELDAGREIKRLLADHPIYDHWLSKQKGCGPLMSAVLIAHIDIKKAAMASQIVAVCGLAVREASCQACKGAGRLGDHNDAVSCQVCDGSGKTMQADRMRKGEKTRYNPWLKSKVLAVLGSSFIKANSPWRKFYDDYKARLENRKVKVCMLCHGSGEFKRKVSAKAPSDAPAFAHEDRDDEIEARPDGKCPVCDGRGGDCPWGRSQKHRHQAAIRYMVKMFLQQLYQEWRTLENLPVRKPYAEEYLGRTHHTS